jgi:hypothetical protein
MHSIYRRDRSVKGLWPGIIAAAVLGACEPADQPHGTAEVSTPIEAGGVVRVAVQNLYLGADLRTLLSSRSPREIPLLVAREFANVGASRFRERARALAADLASNPPQLLGLQEVSLFRLQSPGDLLTGNPIQAADTVLDFLRVLLEELGKEGLAYRPVASYEGMDIEVPSVDSAGAIADIRLTDRGVILARTDIEVGNPRNSNFASNLAVTIGGPDGIAVELTGGWASVQATVAGRSVLFVTTHLESGDLSPEVQSAQAGELLAALDTVTLPVIMVGDFSSTPDGRLTSTYHAVLDAGFVDVWNAALPNDPGLTCCQAPDLRNTESALDRRLDFIFYRPGAIGSANPPGQRPVARLLGADSGSRTPSGLWPSDHAGIQATIPIYSRP